MTTSKIVAAAALALSTIAAGQPSPTSETVFSSISGDSVVHDASGLRFPRDVAGFRRSEISVFAGSSEYVGVEYTKELSGDGPLTLRIAVVRLPQLSPREHYAIAKPVALQSLAGARVLEEGVYSGVKGAESYRGLFVGELDGRPWMRGLWTFERGAWDLRVRIDFAKLDPIAVEEAVGAFVTEMNAVNPG